MSTSVRDVHAVDVHVDDRFVTVRLRDGREIAVPIDWYPRLAEATPVQRADWRLIGAGEGIRWPSLDEDLSVTGMLARS